MFAITAVLFFAVGAGTRLLDHGVDATYLIVRGVGSVVLAAAFTWRFTRTRRDVGGADGLASLRTALRTGELPAEVDRAGWEAALTRRDRVLRRTRWLTPLVAGVLAVFGAWTIFAVPHATAVGALLLLIAVALGVVAVIRTRQALPRIHSLLEQLESRP